MAELTSVPARLNTIKEMIGKLKPEILATIPRHINGERMLRIAVNAIRRNPKLGACTPESLLSCIIEASVCGLELDSGLGEAWMVPFKTEATLIKGYKGLHKLILQSPHVVKAEARCVHEKDHFDYRYGSDGYLRHTRHEGPDRGKVAAVYAMVVYKTGQTQFEVLFPDEIEKHRARSRAANEGPWVTDWDEMAKKTAFLVLSDYVPKTPELGRAIAAEYSEGPLSELADTIMAGQEEAPGPKKGKLEALTEQLQKRNGEPKAGTVEDRQAETPATIPAPDIPTQEPSDDPEEPPAPEPKTQTPPALLTPTASAIIIQRFTAFGVKLADLELHVGKAKHYWTKAEMDSLSKLYEETVANKPPAKKQRSLL